MLLSPQNLWGLLKHKWAGMNTMLLFYVKVICGFHFWLIVEYFSRCWLKYFTLDRLVQAEGLGRKIFPEFDAKMKVTFQSKFFNFLSLSLSLSFSLSLSLSLSAGQEHPNQNLCQHFQRWTAHRLIWQGVTIFTLCGSNMWKCHHRAKKNTWKTNEGGARGKKSKLSGCTFLEGGEVGAEESSGN